MNRATLAALLLSLSFSAASAADSMAAAPRKQPVKAAAVAGSVNGAVREVYRDSDGDSLLFFYGWVDDTDSANEAEMVFHLYVKNVASPTTREFTIGRTLPGCFYCATTSGPVSWQVEGFWVAQPFCNAALGNPKNYANMSIGGYLGVPTGTYDVTLTADNIQGSAGSGKTLGTYRLFFR